MCLDTDAALDLIQSAALFGVMAVLGYLVHLLKAELRAAVLALHAIVKALDDVKTRLALLEQERGHRQ